MKQEAQKPDLQPELQDGQQKETVANSKQTSNDFNFFVSEADRSKASTEEKTDQTKKGETTDKSISFFLPE
ncbi:MAG: hypothetical protein ABSB79_00420 [Syntrophales bacterium]|jgi:hypothetical protein